jgi:hypothetical protein
MNAPVDLARRRARREATATAAPAHNPNDDAVEVQGMSARAARTDADARLRALFRRDARNARWHGVRCPSHIRACLKRPE